MENFDPQSYGPVFAPFLSSERRRPLDAGNPDASTRVALESLDVKRAFASTTRAVADRDMAACCLSGVWLLHDFLDESHTISQGIKTSSGSFWHAIMHRREGDFSNAKYWFRHVGEHPVFSALAERAAKLATARGIDEAAVESFARGGDWDPFGFVDLCQAAQRRGADAEVRELCLDVQQAEWELLFDDCYRAAVGK
jgi:hypothetical protein